MGELPPAGAIQLRSAGVFERWGSTGITSSSRSPACQLPKRSLHRNGICCARGVPLRHPRPGNPGTVGYAELQRLPDASRRCAAERPPPFSRSLPGRFPNAVARCLSNLTDAARITTGPSCELSNAFRRSRMRSLAAPRRSRVPAISALLLACSCPALWLVLSAQAAPPAPGAPLALVSTAWPPFTNPPGQPRIALDLVEAALARIGVSAKTAIVSAPQFTPALESGLFDGSAAAWKDPDRERTLLFSRPYLENRLVLVGRHGADVSAQALGDLKGRTVAIVEGYSYGDAIDSAGAVWVRSRGEEDSLAQLLSGGVDYTLMDELVVHYIVSNYPTNRVRGCRLARCRWSCASCTSRYCGRTPMHRRLSIASTRSFPP